MGLTTGSGPFGPTFAGSHNATAPRAFVLVEPFGRRVRAVRDGRTVVDSGEVSLVHVGGTLARYSFPESDVRLKDATRDPHVPGNVAVDWDAADAWFEEDERVLVHPRDPYHRCDTLASSRLVVVRIGELEVARSTRPRVLYETSLPPRWYLPRADVRMEHLERSPTVTQCPYKGAAHHFSARAGDRVVEDVAWSYEDEVNREGAPVQWLVAFYDTKADVFVDGVRQGG